MTRRQKNNRLGPTAGGRELRLAARPPARFNLLPDTPNYITVPETKTGVPNDLLTQNLRCLLSMSQRACGTEFSFDGRRAGGCGFNGGIIPHTFDNSYGIHT